MTMTQTTSQVVVDFLLGEIDPGFLQAYEFLASLDYPIADYKSFTKQVHPQVEESDEGGSTAKSDASNLVAAFFGPHDFPIMTVEGALEKFHDGLVALIEYMKFPATPEEGIPRGERREMGPHPEGMQDICGQAARRVHDQCIEQGHSPAYCNVRRLVAYLECLGAWRSYSLPFAQKGLQPESLVGRPPRRPPFMG